MTDKEDLVNQSQESLRRPSSFKWRLLIAALICVLLYSLLASYNWPSSSKRRVEDLDIPEASKYRTYDEFRDRYPRYSMQDIEPVEEMLRRMMFNGDLISLGQDNSAYVLGKHGFYLDQSPFKADRFAHEAADIMGQVDDFDMEKMLKGDKPVSGPELEKAGTLGRWFKRLGKSQSHYEIPNFPVDQFPASKTHIDADLRGCLGPIRRQGNCGACYAFSWLALVEWHYCKQSSKKVDFSEQHIVDCGYQAQLKGCHEGYLTRTREFTHTFGLHLESDYPYQAKQGQCKRVGQNIKVKTVDFRRLKIDRQNWEKTLQEQPILVEARVPSDIASYDRGVHPGLNCDERKAHGMLLVGHGVEEGVPYWILRDQQGQDWGESGYLRLSREAPMEECFKAGFISKFRFKDLDETSYSSLYDDEFKYEPETIEL